MFHPFRPLHIDHFITATFHKWYLQKVSIFGQQLCIFMNVQNKNYQFATHTARDITIYSVGCTYHDKVQFPLAISPEDKFQNHWNSQHTYFTFWTVMTIHFWSSFSMNTQSCIRTRWIFGYVHSHKIYAPIVVRP